ncbi:MAG: hypothetical protein MUE96_12570 [Bacteroidia bacterium]|jgi:hypothetical protein|nr:hypothetical protein [Bacteroidia bacterium]
MNNASEQVYVVGELVFAKAQPNEQLRVRRYIDEVYYCTRVLEPDAKERVYFERELSKKCE